MDVGIVFARLLGQFRGEFSAMQKWAEISDYDPRERESGTG